MICALVLAAALNPVIDLFPREVTFHLGFNDGTPQAAVGKTTIPRDFKKYRLGDNGVIGQALVNGYYAYGQAPDQRLITTTKPGTLICWVRLNCEQKPVRQGLSEWEGGGAFVEVLGPNGASFIVMKSTDFRWGSGSMMFYVSAVDKFGKRYSRSVGARCSYTEWKVGEWKMVAVAWTAEKMYISVDGHPFNSTTLNAPLVDYAGPVYLMVKQWNDKNPAANDQPGVFSLDEISVINRKLTDEELKTIYDRTRALSGQKSEKKAAS